MGLQRTKKWSEPPPSKNKKSMTRAVFFLCGTEIDQTKDRANSKMFRVTEKSKRYETSLSFGHLKSHYLSVGGLVGCRFTDTPPDS